MSQPDRPTPAPVTNPGGGEGPGGERGPPSHSGPAANPADHEGCSALPCLGQQAPAQTAPSSWVVLSPREEWDSRKNWVLHRECSTFQRFLRGWQVVPWPSTSDRHSCVLQADPQSEEVASSSLTSPQALERVWGRGPKHQAKTLPESHHQATSWPHRQSHTLAGRTQGRISKYTVQSVVIVKQV